MITSNNRADEHAFYRVLKRLYWLRSIAIVSQLVILVVVVWGLIIPIPLASPLIIVGFLVVTNVFVYLRLRQPHPVTEFEIALNLTIDLSALAALLYFSGGSSNPFVSLFIIPVSLAAAFLRIKYIAWVLFLSAIYYTVLMHWYVPLPSTGGRFGGDFSLHLLGMYATFIVTAVITATFVYALAKTGKRHEQELAKTQEALLRNEHIVSLGVLAASTAHEINTPLNTIGLLADELKSNSESCPFVAEDAEEILHQINYCKQQIQQLQQQAEQIHHKEQADDVLLLDAMHTMLAQWTAMRPEIKLEQHFNFDHSIRISNMQNLRLALMNLLDNAADASLKNAHDKVRISISKQAEKIILDVDDFGAGLSDTQLRTVGKVPYSSKAQGMGIGLMLSHSSLEQMGGQLQLSNHEQQGSRARIIL